MHPNRDAQVEMQTRNPFENYHKLVWTQIKLPNVQWTSKHVLPGGLKKLVSQNASKCQEFWIYFHRVENSPQNWSKVPSL